MTHSPVDQWSTKLHIIGMGLVRDETGIVEIVAANLLKARKGAGLSQEALGVAARVDRTYVSQVEGRKRNITITVLAKFANALGTTPEALVKKP